jgi:hypothetical protein
VVKIGVFIEAIQVAVAQGAIKAEAAAQAIQAFVDVGEFFLRRNPSDTTQPSDAALLRFEKLIQDQAVTVDATTLALLKGIFDSAIASDVKSLGFGKARANSVTLADVRVKTVGKGLTESQQATDQATRVVGKVRASAAAAVDAKALSFGQSRTDSVSVGDVDVLGLSKPRTDQASTSDADVLSVSKTLADAASVTDDLNGSAVADDDQTIQFIKSLTDPVTAQDILQRIVAYTRAFAEPATTADVARKQSSKQRSDSVATSDTGMLFWQDYADPTYFGGDYVGNSQSF